jgi:hypothetical protein
MSASAAPGPASVIARGVFTAAGIVRGTGRYAGITGHGTYQLSLEIVGARVGGHCSSVRPPRGQQELLRLSGPVRR